MHVLDKVQKANTLNLAKCEGNITDETNGHVDFVHQQPAAESNRQERSQIMTPVLKVVG